MATILTGEAGHDEAVWLEKIGEVGKRPSVENIHSNWRVTPTASVADMNVIDSAVAIVRSHYPYLV